MDAFNHRFNQTEIEHGRVPKELHNLGSNVCTILFYVSIGCCSLVLLGYTFIRYFAASHDRLTLRLLIYAAISHIVLSIAGIFRLDPPTRENEPACQAVMFFYIASNLFSIICITCIAINLQVVFVHRIKRYRHLERMYMLLSFVPAITIAIIPIFPKMEGYHYNENMDDCWYIQSNDHVTSLWAFMGLYIWILLSTAYCIIALVLVLWKMYIEELRINEHLQSRTPNQNQGHREWFRRRPFSLCFRPQAHDSINIAMEELGEPQPRSHHLHLPIRPSNVRQLVSSGMQLTLEHMRLLRARQLQMSYLAKVAGRVIWFPAVLILTRIWGVIGFLISYTTQRINPFMLLMSYVSVPIQGIFFLFIFIFDPSLHHAIRKVLGSEDASIYDFEVNQQEKTPNLPAPRRPNLSVLQSPSLPSSPSWYSNNGDMSLSTCDTGSHIVSATSFSTLSFLSDGDVGSSASQQVQSMHPLPDRGDVNPRRATSDTFAYLHTHRLADSVLLGPSSVGSPSRQTSQIDRRSVQARSEEVSVSSSLESIQKEFRQM